MSLPFTSGLWKAVHGSFDPELRGAALVTNVIDGDDCIDIVIESPTPLADARLVAEAPAMFALLKTLPTSLDMPDDPGWSGNDLFIALLAMAENIVRRVEGELNS